MPLLRRGFEDGDWAPFEALLAGRGAEQAVAPSDPLEDAALFDAVAPTLARDHARDPERLVAALRALAAFSRRRLSIQRAALEESRAASSSEESLTITLESIGDGVMATDAAGLIVRMNPVAARLSGWTLEEALGRRFEDVFRVVHDLTRVKVPDRIHEVLSKGVVHGLPKDAAILAKDESVVPIADSLAPILDAAGEVRGAVLVFRDLTMDRTHERELEVSQVALTESHRRLRTLAERIEHTREEERTSLARELHDELAQKLTVLNMDIAWLAPRQPSDQTIERLSGMGRLVEDTFAIVRRITLDLRPPVLDDLGLAAAIEWQASEFEGRTGVRVEVDTTADLPPLSRGKATALFRIFQEILTNVLRHSGGGGVVGCLEVRDGCVTLEVADEGRGIRPEEIANARSFGLLGMRERAELHGGTFSIAAGPDRGTRVVVSIPCDPEVSK